MTYALTNVVRETAFFGSTAEKYELGIERWGEMKATRDYVAEMGSIGSSGNLKDGLVFLWAMERVRCPLTFPLTELIQHEGIPRLVEICRGQRCTAYLRPLRRASVPCTHSPD